MLFLALVLFAPCSAFVYTVPVYDDLVILKILAWCITLVGTVVILFVLFILVILYFDLFNFGDGGDEHYPPTLMLEEGHPKIAFACAVFSLCMLYIAARLILESSFLLGTGTSLLGVCLFLASGPHYVRLIKHIGTPKPIM